VLKISGPKNKESGEWNKIYSIKYKQIISLDNIAGKQLGHRLDN